MSFRIINGKIVPIDIPSNSQSKSKSKTEAPGKSFSDVFQNEINKLSEVKISSHAMERLKRRNIELDSADLKKLTEAIDKAEAKGAKESLLLYKDTAFIASIRNKTIITAVDSESARDNVFTNIDSAVIIS